MIDFFGFLSSKITWLGNHNGDVHSGRNSGRGSQNAALSLIRFPLANGHRTSQEHILIIYQFKAAYKYKERRALLI